MKQTQKGKYWVKSAITTIQILQSIYFVPGCLRSFAPWGQPLNTFIYRISFTNITHPLSAYSRNFTPYPCAFLWKMYRWYPFSTPDAIGMTIRGVVIFARFISINMILPYPHQVTNIPVLKIYVNKLISIYISERY